ncbi:acyltransferase family protein [Cellulophaga sp. L1A9]|uniref:acyltransferase family protein n=1 Tax=Cellulophaga sp. L1A9 TaxID=2686362 RepID=UPI00131CCE5E|nr:acyltransferase family protein [Cellulophaga sp. L1A9]
MKKRFEWIDNIRGLMIILVALGHIIVDGSIDNTFNSIMRMPTFFMISGFLFKFKPYKEYLKHKFIHLIIPYFVYLVPILALQMYFEEKSYLEYFGRLVLGGPFLYTWTGVFWFITCLFFTQQIFNLLNGWKIQKIALLMFLFLILAYTNQLYFQTINIPLSLNICLYSCPLFFTGFLFKKLIGEVHLAKIVPIISIIIIFIASTFYFNELYINMKLANYGIPFLSFILSILSAFCMIKLFKSFEKNVGLNIVGKASMVIMYLHLPINYLILNFYPNFNQWLLLLIAISIPTCLYYVFRRNNITKKYLLGER